jgi:hypothetical protein
MLKGGITQYKEFIETLAVGLDGVNHFIYGDATKIVAYSKSNAKFGYPLIHLARPVIVTDNNGFGHETTHFYGEITCITKVDKTGLAADLDGKELVAEAETLDALMAIEKLLRKRNDEGDIDYTKTSEIEPIVARFIDSHMGWKLGVKITLGANSTDC